MLRSRTGVLWCAALFACAPAASLGQQQAAKDYPSKPIRLVVPFVHRGSLGDRREKFRTGQYFA